MATYNITAEQLRGAGILNSFEITAGGSSFNTLSTRFDGVNDFCETSANYSELDGTNKATFSFWIKPPSTIANFQVISSTIKNSTTSHHQFQVRLATNATIQISIHSESKYIRASSTPLNLNAWNHVMFCIDTSQPLGSQRGRTFINGVDSTSATTVGGTFATSTGALYFGANENGHYNNFEGDIDEFAIWSGTDQRANISEIYGGGVAVDLNSLATAPSPTTWYRMGDGDTFPTLQDTNGSADLTMTNMTSGNIITDVPT